ncbi:hypothetical protein ABBQ32_001497 [Trebouxia sp. C0010 RCD-2024]
MAELHNNDEGLNGPQEATVAGTNDQAACPAESTHRVSGIIAPDTVQATPSTSGRPPMPRLKNSGTQSHFKVAEFEEDVSTWGRQVMEDQDYEDDELSHASLSSGLSPRESRPRTRPWDLAEGYQSLAYHSGLYSRAQAMRKNGQSPANMGMADDLPMRLAAEQLHALAGMSQKVQEAIVHSQKTFEHQHLLAGRALLRKVVKGWQGIKQRHVNKQQVLQRAIQRMRRSELSRCFYLWKDRFGEVDDYARKRRKCEVMIRQGLVRRVFGEWQRLCQERDWKTQLATRDNEIKRMDREYRKLESRPIYLMAKKRLRRVVQEWQAVADAKKASRQQLAAVQKSADHKVMRKAWLSWQRGSKQQHQRKLFFKRTCQRLAKLRLQRMFHQWGHLVGAKLQKQANAAHIASYHRQKLQAKAWNRWRQYHIRAQKRKRALTKGHVSLMGPAFRAWMARACMMHKVKAVAKTNAHKHLQRLLSGAFRGWSQAADKMCQQTLADGYEQLASQVGGMKAENERLRRDNERFVRLIDSGEWGRGRVAELTQAGELMQSERDALLKLIQSLRHEYEAVQAAKLGQESEIQGLKEKMVLGGAARNRMLIKGGSSFNALVRALKQDVVTGAAPTTTANEKLMYEVDKLSMDHVQVFPDGELNVQAAASRDTSPSFVRPISKAHQHRPNRTPDVPKLPRYEEAARISISSPKQMSIGGRSHAVNRASRPSSALSRQSPNAAIAAGHESSSATRPPSGHSTPVKSGSATPQKPAGSSTPKREGGSHASAVVGALGRLSPQEVDRLQRVLQQGGAHP